mmetsp:Transcript_32764/g.79406  ORF Transcript_32764/g.79406 Transcript_32764/m.79406 type:complete len:184 (-) Transcript_32764:32-583(-)
MKLKSGPLDTLIAILCRHHFYQAETSFFPQNFSGGTLQTELQNTMTHSTESATSKLIGKAIDIVMTDFEFDFDQDPIDNISESVEQDVEGDLVDANLDMEVEEILNIARERRIRKQGNRCDANDVNNDSLRHINTSFYSLASSTMGEDDEEYELPLNDCHDVKCSKNTSIRRTSLTSLLEAGW